MNGQSTQAYIEPTVNGLLTVCAPALPFCLTSACHIPARYSPLKFCRSRQHTLQIPADSQRHYRQNPIWRLRLWLPGECIVFSCRFLNETGRLRAQTFRTNRCGEFPTAMNTLSASLFGSRFLAGVGVVALLGGIGLAISRPAHTSCGPIPVIVADICHFRPRPPTTRINRAFSLARYTLSPTAHAAPGNSGLIPFLPASVWSSRL